MFGYGDDKKKKKGGKVRMGKPGKAQPTRKPKFSSSPKKEVGKKKSFGHGMAGLFGVTPKKPEPDNAPRTRAGEARTRQARMKRLDGQLI